MADEIESSGRGEHRRGEPLKRATALRALPFALSLAVLLALSSCQSESRVIVLIGDSILEGRMQKTDTETVMGGELAIPGILAQRLEPAHQLHNLGYGGTSVRDWHPRDWKEGGAPGTPIFETIPASDIAVILLGTNDAIGHFEEDSRTVPPDEFEERLRDIVEALKSKPVSNIILVTPPVPPLWRGKDQGELLAQYAPRVLSVCRRTESTCVDLAASMPDSGYIQGIHPTAEGHAFIAEQLLRALEDLL
jgi:lysophospholipase L1-like esterase